MNLGIFDVVGPIMHGPSSNHTGGVNRIGAISRQIMGGCPKQIHIGLHPALMVNYTGQRTHTAMVAGLLGIRESDIECNEALKLAQAKGISWEVYPVEPEASRNTMRASGIVNGVNWVVNGDSIGGGNILIDRINGMKVEIDGNSYEIVAISEDSAILSQLKEYLFSLGMTKQWTEGTVKEGYLICGVFTFEPPDLEALPDKLRSEVLEGRLKYHTVAPITTFCPKNSELPLFSSFAELEQLCKKQDLISTIVQYECMRDDVTADEVWDEMRFTVDVMIDTLERGQNGSINLIGGLTAPDDGEKLLHRANKDEGILGSTFSRSLGLAIISSQMNASGERIVAAPTGGSSGILPAVLTTLANRYSLGRDDMVRACFSAAAIGIVVGKEVMFSGTTSGCQGEVGVSAGMAAGAAVWMAGGTPKAVFHAAALAIKNLLGLTCDLTASPIEVPCIKRNAVGTAVALAAAEMALAGIQSAVTPDDVAAALSETARLLPPSLKCTQEHGLAGTSSGACMQVAWCHKLSTMFDQI